MVKIRRDKTGKSLKNTRISNSTFIGNFEKLSCGDHVFIGHFNFIDASNDLTIGEGCQITNYVSVLTHSSHMSIRLYGREYKGSDMVGYVKGSVSIGDYTFIGPHSVVMPGTRIGKGCIVSAYSLVKGEFPDFSILSGNPAMVIGDTRDLDAVYLEQHPKLKTYYTKWANSK